MADKGARLNIPYTVTEPPELPGSSDVAIGGYLNISDTNEIRLRQAYEHCRTATKTGSKTFYFGSRFLPYSKRQAMWAVYSFCRQTDDLVDNAQDTGPEELRARLLEWENELRLTFNGLVRKGQPAMLAWNHAAQLYGITQAPPLELIEGVRMDLEKTRYANFDELRLYCYRVASTVGLMASQVIGYSDPCALEYAVNLGIAMQLTNILRDVGEDARSGRIYLPLEELEEYGYSPNDLLGGVINEPFIRLMQFQIARARHYYDISMPGIAYLDKECRFSITVAARLYSRILDAIERNSYNVFTRRAYVPKAEKLRSLAGAWVGCKLGRNSLAAYPLHVIPNHEEADA